MEEDEATEHARDPTPEPTQENIDPETEERCANLRSILYANIGACHVKLVSSGSECHLGAFD
jgi:hypothetical protein